jgi:molybdopterin-guanine dinucleotide biosynthesis protein A
MKISAVLLAGGESRRFGQDKATFLWSGKPLWQRQLDILRAVEPDQILLSARTDPRWRPNDITFVPDEAPSRGPISGLAAAFGEMKGSHLLVLAVDMPSMTENYLLSLVGQATPDCGVVPIVNGEPEPLAAIYPREAAAIVADVIGKNSDLSLRGLISKLLRAKQMRSILVAPNELILFQNINEPRDAMNKSRTS